MGPITRNGLEGRLVVLSAHPDDAVWSLGSGMTGLARGRDVLLLTLFDGDATAGSTLAVGDARWRRFASPPLRREEDIRAAMSLGIERAGAGFDDAALRLDGRDRFAHADINALFLPARVDPALWPEPDAMQLATVRAMLRPADIVCAPLGIGGHVDHCLTHRLARQLDNPVCFYADFPYVGQLDEQALASHVERLGLGLVSHSCQCSWDRWLKAALMYRSQVMMLFASQARFVGALAAHAQVSQTGACCRIWSSRSM
ncbi:putative LmbE-like protein [Pseudomonas asplenii]|uniref:Putative LmbE-like protein n=1 Tax=Pseudomonas asplenii TaxID=53407 RepID=A0A0M9GJ15_9PSED|nr:putative LmbE-like protein [Pseudomonas fuscovaginae]KPA95977.1 putative LmbE-like protein [Pseudomonas fuscovaginae]